MTTHALVFIDTTEARIFHVDKANGITVHPDVRHARKMHAQHHRSDGKHTAPDREFLEELSTRLRGIDEILIVGPGQAKNEFVHHLALHAHEVNKHVVGVDTVDHPTDPQLVALAKKRFKAIDAFL